MLLTIQATLSCHACGQEANPVNALVSSVECRKCGAQLPLPDEMWTAALEGTRYRAGSLADKARGHVLLQTHGCSFRFGYTRTEPSCPHCSVAWSSLPTDACPACHVAVSRRAAPVEVEGVDELIAEDRALVFGAVEAGLERVQCGSCGAPLELGEERRIECSACNVVTVVPDELWRRAKAPELAARWILSVDAEGASSPVESLGFDELAIGPEGVVYVVGSEYPIDQQITALAPDLSRRLWTHELEGHEPRPIPLPDGRVALITQFSKTVQVASAAGVETLFTVEGNDVIQDGVLHQGTLLLALGHHRILHRFDLQGQPLPVWPPVGFFRRMFGADGPLVPTMEPSARPRGTVTGRLGCTNEGSLLLSWGPKIVRYDPEGAITWELGDRGWAAVSSGLGGTRAGGAWFCVMVPREDDSLYQLIRIAPDGSAFEVVCEYSAIMAMAVGPDDSVLAVGVTHVDGVGGSFELIVLDASGTTLRTLPVNR